MQVSNASKYIYCLDIITICVVIYIWSLYIYT